MKSVNKAEIAQETKLKALVSSWMVLYTSKTSYNKLMISYK